LVTRELEKQIEYLKNEVILRDYDKELTKLLIKAYDAKLDALYSNLEEQEHRYEQIILDYKRKEILNNIVQV